MSAESSSDSCPRCKGAGRVDDPTTTAGLLCTACWGTGDRAAYREYQAYRLGVLAGVDAMTRAMPDGDRLLGLEGVRAALDAGEQEVPWQPDVDR